MKHLMDEFAISLAEAVPRRESLRRLGGLFATAVLAPFGVSQAWGAKPPPDPCKTFCNCKGKAQTQCLAACHAANGDTSRVCGACGSYVTCAAGLACCNGSCTSLVSNANCGGCGNVCAAGEMCCGGICTDTSSDSNCGACGNDCSASGRTCCNGACADLQSDGDNCGACGNVCPAGTVCLAGVCSKIVCTDNSQCATYEACCDGACMDVSSDPSNCGSCGFVCPDDKPYCNGFGVCTECGLGFVFCDGLGCVVQDESNCGKCGFTCLPDEVCFAGRCFRWF